MLACRQQSTRTTLNAQKAQLCTTVVAAHLELFFGRHISQGSGARGQQRRVAGRSAAGRCGLGRRPAVGRLAVAVGDAGVGAFVQQAGCAVALP